MKHNILDNKSPVIAKLALFGFCLNGDIYSYTTTILDGRFEMRVDISAVDKTVKTEVMDLSTGDPYTLHMIADASGAFVGKVRAEYERVLTDIADKCFEKDVFKSEIAHEIIRHAREKHGDELEFLWDKFPTDAVLRRQDNDKWYAVFIVLSKRKLGLDSDESVDIVDLRVDPETLTTMVDGKKYFPGYHMNKKHWITICLDGSVALDEVRALLDNSYALAKKC